VLDGGEIEEISGAVGSIGIFFDEGEEFWGVG